MKNQSRKKGIIISYLVTGIRSASQLLLISLYLRILGVDDYGFYQYICSIGAYVTIFDFGVNSIISKYVVEYRVNNDRRGIENILFYCFAFTGFAVFLIAILGVVICSNVGPIFGQMSPERTQLAKVLLIMMISNLSLTMVQRCFEGILTAFEHYVTLKLVALAQVCVKIALVLLLLYSNVGSAAIVASDLAATVVCLLFCMPYCFGKLKVKIRYHFYDKKIVSDSVRLSVSLCLQSVILYANTSIDKYVLGRLLGDAAVTIYSVAWSIEYFFEELPCVIQGMFLPEAVKLVHRNASGEELTDFVIRPGRYQFILCAGMLGGFLLFGREFIRMWSGEETVFAWWIAICLMIPSIIPLFQNVCLSILTAKNKRMFRSIALGCTAALNLILTIILVKAYGIIGAPIATCVSCLLGNNLAMNLYYKYKIGIKVGKLIKEVVRGILPCAAVTSVLCLGLVFVPVTGWLWFLVKCVVFCVIYAVLLWRFGINKAEKAMVMRMIPFLKKTA